MIKQDTSTMALDDLYRDRKVLVTGGGGFLGQRLTGRLRSLGAKIIAPRRAECDLTRFESCLQLLENNPVDLVIHGAALSGGIRIMRERSGEIFFSNAMMGIGMMEAARRCGVTKFVAIGSSCAYPGHLEGELEERSLWDGPPHESVAPLAVAKRLAQIQGLTYRQQWGFVSVQLILPSLYGPGDTFNLSSAHVASSLIRKFVEAQSQSMREVECWGTGRPVREFLFIEDAVEGILEASAVYDDTQPLNIGTGQPTTIRNLAEIVKELTGYGGEIRWDTTKPDGQLVKVLSVKRCHSILRWRAKTSLAEGLSRTVAWYRDHKDEADSSGGQVRSG